MHAVLTTTASTLVLKFIDLTKRLIIITFVKKIIKNEMDRKIKIIICEYSNKFSGKDMTQFNNMCLSKAIFPKIELRAALVPDTTERNTPLANKQINKFRDYKYSLLFVIFVN